MFWILCAILNFSDTEFRKRDHIPSSGAMKDKFISVEQFRKVHSVTPTSFSDKRIWGRNFPLWQLTTERIQFPDIYIWDQGYRLIKNCISLCCWLFIGSVSIETVCRMNSGWLVNFRGFGRKLQWRNGIIKNIFWRERWKPQSQDSQVRCCDDQDSKLVSPKNMCRTTLLNHDAL